MDVASAQLLVAAVKDRDVSLAGIKPDQAEAEFSGWGLKPADAVLLASDLSKAGVSASLTSCNVLENSMGVPAAELLVAAVKGRDVSLAGIKPDQATADLSFKNLGPTDAVLLASDLSKAGVSAVLTNLE